MRMRAFCSGLMTAFLMLLVWLQVVAANKDGYATVEQLQKAGKTALSLDRHYAMGIDLCILSPLVGLTIFLCWPQWRKSTMWIVKIVVIILILVCLFFVWIGGNEAHVHDRTITDAGYLHAVFAGIVVWTLIMMVCATPKPDPVLMLMFCIATPAFFFVGTHMFLGLINYEGAASTFGGSPLKDKVGWTIIVGSALIVWIRTYFIVPSSFWDSIR